MHQLIPMARKGFLTRVILVILLTRRTGLQQLKKMNTTLFLKFADGRQATRSFDEDTTLNSTLKFDDQVNYYIDWAAILMPIYMNQPTIRVGGW